MTLEDVRQKIALARQRLAEEYHAHKQAQDAARRAAELQAVAALDSALALVWEAVGRSADQGKAHTTVALPAPADCPDPGACARMLGRLLVERLCAEGFICQGEARAPLSSAQCATLTLWVEVPNPPGEEEYQTRCREALCAAPTRT